MQNFIITFGAGKDAINIELASTDILQALADLKMSGWEVENVTKVKTAK